MRDVRLRNVVAVLPGRSPRRIYVSGHYDTVARAVPATPVQRAARHRRGRAGAPDRASATGGFDWAAGDIPAPGANDDGSGTALTMEAARVLAQSGLEFDATLVFVAFAGEEQGLVGAHLHAQKAVAEKAVIDAVFNNDIIGNSRGGNGTSDAASVRVFADGPEDSLSRQLARYVQRMAARYVPSHRVRLIARHDRFGRGGDHTAFNQRGYAGVRFSEANENFARQHVVDDTPDGVDAAYLARNTRVNLAGVASLALAPAAPAISNERGVPLLDRNPSGYDARLRWQASAGRGGLPHLLARGLDARLAVRAARGQRHRGDPAAMCRSTTTCSAWPRSGQAATRASCRCTSTRRERRSRSGRGDADRVRGPGLRAAGGWRRASVRRMVRAAGTPMAA